MLVMADVLARIDDELAAWIEAQPVFFVGSAPAEGGHVNVSPKGLDTLRVVGPTTIAYLDLTGSGAETIAHIRQNRRVTVMLCAFEGPPRILRLFGHGQAHPSGSNRYEQLAPRFPALAGARAVIEVALDRIQTSCGFAVPFMEMRQDRPTLQQWAGRKSEAELAAYREEHNRRSIDDIPALGS